MAVIFAPFRIAPAASDGEDMLPASPKAYVTARLHPLIREIGLVLAFKLVALFFLYTFFFSPAHRIDVTPERVHGAVFGTHADNPADQ